MKVIENYISHSAVRKYEPETGSFLLIVPLWETPPAPYPGWTTNHYRGNDTVNKVDVTGLGVYYIEGVSKPLSNNKDDGFRFAVFYTYQPPVDGNYDFEEMSSTDNSFCMPFDEALKKMMNKSYANTFKFAKKDDQCEAKGYFPSRDSYIDKGEECHPSRGSGEYSTDASMCCYLFHSHPYDGDLSPSTDKDIQSLDKAFKLSKGATYQGIIINNIGILFYNHDGQQVKITNIDFLKEMIGKS